MLSIEWLLLQDPTKTFSKSKPQLPGQEHPGLGMLRELLEMLYQACLRLELDGLIMQTMFGAFHTDKIEPVGLPMDNVGRGAEALQRRFNIALDQHGASRREIIIKQYQFRRPVTAQIFRIQ